MKRRFAGLPEEVVAQQMAKRDALLMHIRHLKYAIATTSCRHTVAVLREMLSESEAELGGMVATSPAGDPAGHVRSGWLDKVAELTEA